MAYIVKVYVVQKADKEGKLGELLAVKLTWTEAHTIARRNAPAGVTPVIADKTEELNVGHGKDQV